ncbi:MAG: ribonuclease E/G [Acetobacteraceae bacterium]
MRGAAIDASGRLTDVAVWRPAEPDGVGDLYGGRIIRHVPALAGAFVALGREQDGFLPDRDGAVGLAEGTLLAVRIVRAAQGGKGPRLSCCLAPEEREAAKGLVGLVRRGANPIERLAGWWPGAPIAVDDAEIAVELGAALPGRIKRGSGFDPALEGEIAELAAPEVALAGGARLTIQPTRAVVAIDVDAGAAAGLVAEAHRAINRAAIPEIARQIRLRNLSGAILVDLAGQSVRARRGFSAAFATALAPDPIGPRLLGFTALGLAEILRPRQAPPLFELLAGPFAAGLAALREVVRASLAEPAAVWGLAAAPGVVAALEADSVALRALQRRTGRALSLRSDPGLGAERWLLERVR